jgi:hypothetical protein
METSEDELQFYPSAVLELYTGTHGTIQYHDLLPEIRHAIDATAPLISGLLPNPENLKTQLEEYDRPYVSRNELFCFRFKIHTGHDTRIGIKQLFAYEQYMDRIAEAVAARNISGINLCRMVISFKSSPTPQPCSAEGRKLLENHVWNSCI